MSKVTLFLNGTIKNVVDWTVCAGRPWRPVAT